MPGITVANQAPSKANLGYGAQFFVGAGSPIVYTAVAEVTSITRKKFSVPAIDTTHLQSPNATGEMIGGIMKPGTYELAGTWTADATQIAVDALAGLGLFPFQATAPMQSNTKTATTTGYCFVTESEEGPYEADKKIDFKITIQVTGKPVTVVA